MKITLELDPTNQEEVNQALTLLGGNAAFVNAKGKTVNYEDEAPKAKVEKPAAPKAKAAPKKAAPVEEADDDSDDDESAVTLDDVRTRAKELISSGNREAVKEILDELGAASVTKLTEDQYAQFIEAADAL